MKMKTGDQHIKDLFNYCISNYLGAVPIEDIDFESTRMQAGYHDFKLWYYNFFLGITLKEDENV